MTDLHSIARGYLQYLGRQFPQQCASDEFYFLPRSETANRHLNELDDLAPEKIQDHIRYVRDLLRRISSAPCDHREDGIDRVLLQRSMESFIREFQEAKVWQTDPMLYIKIPLFAIERVLSDERRTIEQISTDLSTIFEQIPSFLHRAVLNLRLPSAISLQVAQSMAEGAFRFFERDVRGFLQKRIAEHAGLQAGISKVLEAWKRFKETLSYLPAERGFAVGEEELNRIFAISLGTSRTPDEVLEIAEDAKHETEKRLRARAGKIDSCKAWSLVEYDPFPPAASLSQMKRQFAKEVENLRRFFYAQEILTLPFEERVVVLPTPSYLQSLRATASYRAPLTGSITDPGIFYITPGQEDAQLIRSHRPYLCAHETYPGHHVLDQLRIHHTNPVRRQIESPLFYEGWACYAEQLLDELGYIENPRQQLVQLKRQLWRDLRAILDIKLQTGRMTLSQAVKAIEALGFTSERAKRQIRRFALTPGYQSCYFLGSYEINRLRRRYASGLDLKSFHDALLEAGQIPFHLVDKALQAHSEGPAPAPCGPQPSSSRRAREE